MSVGLGIAVAERMRHLLALLLLSSAAHGGDWKRVSSETITFTGEITKDDVTSFQRIYRSTDTTLILNSSGGLNGPALRIAETLIKNKKLETVVRGLCASSCADYLFLAGSTRKIDHGVVGYHGSLRAYLESEKFRDDVSKIDPKIVAHRLPQLRQTAKEEDAFFAAAGVPLDIFNRTQIENDAGLYDIYVPGPNAFAKYGIRNVVGSQDLDLMRSLQQENFKILYDDSSDIGTGNSASSTTR